MSGVGSQNKPYIARLLGADNVVIYERVTETPGHQRTVRLGGRSSWELYIKILILSYNYI
jgi:hypothetical protein